MGWRPIRATVAGLGLVAVLGGWFIASDETPAASEPVPGPVVRGEILDPLAPASAGDGWEVEHHEPGLYVVTAPGRVEVQSWDAAADVQVVPLAGDRTEVRFDSGDVPIDTAFTFLARDVP